MNVIFDLVDAQQKAVITTYADDTSLLVKFTANKMFTGIKPTYNDFKIIGTMTIQTKSQYWITNFS